jgi:hypothetical protein
VIPPAFAPPADTFVLDEPVNPLSRHVAVMPQIQANAAFKATQLFKYDAFSHGSLQTVIDQLDAFTFLQIPEGEYKNDLYFTKPIYVRGEGTVSVVGSGKGDVMTCDGDFVVIDGITIVQNGSAHGAVCVNSGYASLMNCNVISAALSPVIIFNAACVDLFNCDLSGAANPLLRVSDSAICRCDQTAIHDGKTYGVLVENNASLTLIRSSVNSNGAIGVKVVGKAHLQMNVTQVFKNGQSGVDLSSSGHLSIEDSAVYDHQQGSLVIVHGDAAVVLSRSQFIASGFAGVCAFDGGVVQSSGNIYQDSHFSSLLVARGRGYVASQGDTFQGKAAVAVTTFSAGFILMKGGKIEGVSGGGVLCYERSKIVIENTTISQAARYGVQVRNGSILEMTNVHVVQTDGPCLCAMHDAHGFVRECQFGASQTVGWEFAHVHGFAVTGCEFVDCAVVGIIMRYGIGVLVKDSKITGNGEAGVDLWGANCSPIFVNCNILDNDVVGLNVRSGATGRVYDALVAGKQFGISVADGHLVGERVTVSNCLEAGITVTEGGKVTLGGSQVRENRGFGCQVQGKGSTVRFVKTTFARHATSILTFGDAVAQCEQCNFEGAGQVHCEVRQAGILHLEGCDVGQAQSGIGLQVHETGVLQLSATKIHGDARFGIWIGEGQCKALKSFVAECAGGGVYTQDGAEGEFESCTIHANGEIGMQVQGGSVRINNCTVSRQAYGVVVRPPAKFSETATRYENNNKKDLYRI